MILHLNDSTAKEGENDWRYGARRMHGTRFYGIGPSFRMRRLFKRIIVSLRKRCEHVIRKAGIWWGPRRELRAGTVSASAPRRLRRKH
jgi:hypothetical protein